MHPRHLRSISLSRRLLRRVLAASIAVLSVVVLGKEPAGAFTAAVADSTGAQYPVAADLLPEATLTASDAAQNEFFGSDVAIDANTAVIGSSRDDIGANADQGSAYVFVRTNGRWTQQAKLVLPNGAASDFFGWRVAVSGDSILVANHPQTGSSSVYAFERSGTTWSAPSRLSPSVPGNSAASIFYFGADLDLRGDRAIFGSTGERIGPGNVFENAAYIFEKTGGSWTQRARLTPTGANVGHDFGRGVAIDGDTAVVAAPTEDNGSTRDHGYAYVFQGSGTSWTQQDRITSSDATQNSMFGKAIAVRGSTIVATARNGDSSSTDATAAGAPTWDTPIVNGSTVSLSWSPAGGGAPTSYTLVASATPGGAPVATVPVGSTSASFSEVPSGTYYLRLTASNGAGSSPPSAEVMLTVQ